MMLHGFKVRTGTEPYVVQAEVIICGNDLNLCIAGGQVYHIGATALAISRKSLSDGEANSASASVICVVGHKEDELARKTALELATLMHSNVNVTVGIHIDRATKNDIQVLLENYEKLLSKIKKRLLTCSNMESR